MSRLSVMDRDAGLDAARPGSRSSRFRQNVHYRELLQPSRTSPGMTGGLSGKTTLKWTACGRLCLAPNMAANSLDRRSSNLEACRYRFGRHEAARVVKLLRSLDAARFADPRFADPLPRSPALPESLSAKSSGGPHHRAHPQQFPQESRSPPQVRRRHGRLRALEVSGIAGTQMEDTLSFDVASWLIQRMPGKVEIAWENYEPGREFRRHRPALHPLA